VIWLARWRCRECGRSFTDYPDFRPAVQALRHSLPGLASRGLSRPGRRHLSPRRPARALSDRVRG
jgi:hypothetical protein